MLRCDCSHRHYAVRRNVTPTLGALLQGVMVDVWWGIAEREAQGTYDFSAYAALFARVAAAGLKLQAVMSFHAAGANVGDTCSIALPRWVHEAGDADPDIFFTDRAGTRNRECLSIAADHEPVLGGRTPLEVYEGFVRAFCEHFYHLFGARLTGLVQMFLPRQGPAGSAVSPCRKC